MNHGTVKGETPWIDPDTMAASFRERASAVLAGFGTNVATSCEPDPPAGRVFLAEATVETSVGEVTITYGDREFEVRTFVCPTGQRSPLDLVFFLDAMGYDSEDVIDSLWVNSPGRLGQVLEDHVEALVACLDALSSDHAGLWEAAEHLRLTAVAHAQERLERDGLRRASARAANAFREGNFPEVVDLLRPYEDILTEAQKLKLKLAVERSAAGR